MISFVLRNVHPHDVGTIIDTLNAEVNMPIVKSGKHASMPIGKRGWAKVLNPIWSGYVPPGHAENRAIALGGGRSPSANP